MVVLDTISEVNREIEQVASVKSKEIELNNDKEATISAMKVEAIALEENNAKAKISSTYDATTRTISGIVTDETNLPLPAVNVMIKGTSQRTQTNFNGEFSLQAEKGDQLVFSFIGFENGYATVGKSDVLNFKMLAESQALSEVVVVAYGMSKKKNRTKEVMSVAAVGSGSAPNINNSNNSYSVNQALQGKVAGVQITNNSGYLSQGSPGASPTIAIRGIASISKSNDPIYIIDGVPVTANDFKQLKPENVKSINVLKETAATSLYGSRAYNGVIIVNTKNGTYQNLSKKELQRKLKKLDKNKKSKEIILPPKSIEVSQEDYDNFVENQFESPKSAPLSTFSIDVDNASYTNVRRFINNGQSVPKDAVRVVQISTTTRSKSVFDQYGIQRLSLESKTPIAKNWLARKKYSNGKFASFQFGFLD